MKGDSLFALIAGAAAGLTLGLLFAPEKGEETRRKVKAAAAEGWDEFVDATDDGWEKAKETYKDVKEGAESATTRLRARAARSTSSSTAAATRARSSSMRRSRLRKQAG